MNKKIQGVIVGDKEARELLTHHGIRKREGNLEEQHFRRMYSIARAYFSADSLGDKQTRDQIFGVVLAELDERRFIAEKQMYGLRRRREEQTATMIDNAAPWISEYRKIFKKSQNKSHAARQVKRKYRLEQTAKAIVATAERINKIQNG